MEFDFVVIGSGIAGLTFSLEAAEHGSVCLLTKRGAPDSNTAWAQGGIACVISDEDSFDLHVADTMEVGAGLCREETVRTIVTEGPESIEAAIALGVEFDQRPGGGGGGGAELDLAREGGHSRRRILHTRDTTGLELETKLLAAVRGHSNIELLEHHFALDLITTAKVGMASQNRCIGLYALNEERGEVIVIRSDRVVLATGGCGKVYLYTTTPDVATGDGVAMAWRAGAAIANMEFIQFHPTCLFHPQAKSFLISEAVRGEGGVLIDAEGREFMDAYDQRKSLAPRDIVARAIDREIKKKGSQCVYVDITHKPADFVRTRFPHIYETCLKFGIDITREPIPVVPAAHYQCGGVLTDVNGVSTVSGLYAVGEVACSGMHGANRLASNSLLEGLVVARRAALHMMEKQPPSTRMEAFDLPEWVSGDVTDVDELVVIYHNWDEIRRLMWDYVSIVRTTKRLQRAATRLRNLKREVEEFYWNFKISSDLLELRNLVEVAALIVDSAARRKESRGLHYTLNYPELDDTRFAADTVLRRF